MTISVIVPTHNRVALLLQNVESLLRQDFTDREIIIVNDGSTDGTDRYLSSLETSTKIVYVRQDNRGPAAARNAGLRVARGRYAAFTDDDCVVPARWLARIVAVFESGGYDIVGGVVRNCVRDNIYSELSQDIVNHFVKFLSESREASGFLTSNNIAYRTEVIRGAGGFDERFRRAGGEERALNYAILRKGGKSTLATDLVVDHYHAMTAGSFFKQQCNYGRGSYTLYRIVGKNLNPPPPMIPVSAYLSLLLSWLRIRPLAGITKVMLFLSGQIMVAAGFIMQALAPRRRSQALPA